MADFLYDLLYILPVLLSASVMAVPYLNGPEKSAFVYGVAFLTAAVFIVLKHWKNKIKYLIPGIILTLIGVVILFHDSKERMDFIVSNRWFLYIVLTAFAAFLIGQVLSGFRVARRVSFVAVFALLILNMVIYKGAPKVAVDAALFLLLIIAADEVQHFWEKSGDTDAKKHLVFISPFLLMTAIFIYIIPASDRPVDYTAVVRFAKKTIAYVKENTVWIHKGEEDYASYIGFSDDGTFKSGLRKNDKTVMLLATEANSDPVVYLSGKVMDTFTGRTWSGEYTQENNDRLTDTLELLCAVKEYGEGNETDYIRRNKISLKYDDFYTNYCFVPSKLIPGDQRISGVKVMELGGDLVSEELLGYGSEYTTFSYRINRSHEKFREMLEGEELSEALAVNQGESKTEREIWEETVLKYMPGVPLPYEDYLAYKEKVYRLYLPETKLSEDAEHYLDELLKDSESDYESLCLIEKALSSMTYTYTPGKLPNKVTNPEEFVDYFLFEKQEGYCTFFATTFVLMARNRGIPARMVQGFRVENKPGKTVNVRSDMAHSWAEAYIDGVGFVIFDPTPGGMQEIYWMSEEERQSYKPSGAGYAENTQTETTLPDSDTETETPKKKVNPLVILISVLAVIVLFVLYLIIARVIGIMRYRKKNPEERFFMICRKNLRILGFMGFRFAPGETVEEFGRRIQKKKNASLTAFLNDYERICYAEERVTEDMLKQTENNSEILMTELKNTRGRRLTWLIMKAGF